MTRTCLLVLISGRVTDVQWNSTGDLVEIVVQSFGTELVKYLKGRNSNITISENVTDEKCIRPPAPREFEAFSRTKAFW